MRLMVSVKGIIVVAFTTRFLFIYGLAADVLFRHRTFLPPRFEALPHYYLFAVSFTRHAITKPSRVAAVCQTDEPDLPFILR